MPSFEAAPPPEPGERESRPPGTVYGAPAETRPLQDRFIRIALAVGAAGLLVGTVFASGLFAGGGPPGEPQHAGAGPATSVGGAAAGATPTSEATAGPSATSPGATPAPSATPAPAALGPAEARTFRSVVNALCLDIAAGEDPEGADVQQQPCTGVPSQRWQPAPAGPDTVTLVNQGSGKCLDVDNFSTDDGAPVQQWSCNGGANQQWRVATGPGPVVLVNVNSGKCVALADPGAGAGSKVRQVSCDGAPDKQWLGQPLT